MRDIYKIAFVTPTTTKPLPGDGMHMCVHYRIGRNTHTVSVE